MEQQLNIPPEHQFLTLRELINLTKTSKSSLYRWMSENKFPHLEYIGPSKRGLRLSTYQQWAKDPKNWKA